MAFFCIIVCITYHLAYSFIPWSDLRAHISGQQLVNPVQKPPTPPSLGVHALFTPQEQAPAISLQQQSNIHMQSLVGSTGKGVPTTTDDDPVSTAPYAPSITVLNHPMQGRSPFPDGALVEKHSNNQGVNKE